MRANYYPASVVTETPASIMLIAEGKHDCEKLRDIVEFMAPIVIGESRCERTGWTRVVEIGLPRNEVQQSVEGKSSE